VPRNEVPYRPAAEYDLTAEYTRTDGYSAVTLLVTRGGGACAWTLALRSKGYGFRVVNGRDIPHETPDTQTARVVTGRRHVTRVEVRKDRLTGYLDGEKIADVRTDGVTLAVPGGDRLRDDTLLGVACSPGVGVTFHRLAVTEV